MNQIHRLSVAFAILLAAGGAAASPASDAAAEAFITNETQFHLGILPTEQSHPKTRGLSQVLATNTAAGVAMLLSVDDDIPPVAERVFAGAPFAKMVAAVRRAKAGGRRVFFSGCGATGRLAILLNAAVRRAARETGDSSLAAFSADIMTGGDYALVKSVEMFEDYISFGRQQAVEAGLAAGDVLIAISEGGETSSVIGTVLRGAEVGAETFFVFNNPPDLLAGRLERCRRVIRNPAVTVVNLTTGPMAVAGSTRMQATTAELLVVGAAVEQALFGRDPAQTLKQFRTLLAQLRSPENLRALAAFTDFEEGLYRRHGRMTYFADDWLLDIFTDTTERSPTFKLPPFRPAGETNSPAPWTAVKDLSRGNREAWLRVYEGEPRCLAWTPDDYIRLGASEAIRRKPPRITVADLMAFPIGNELDPSRTEIKPNAALAMPVGGAKLDSARWAVAAAPFETRKVFRLGAGQPGDDFAVAVGLPQSPLHLWEHLGLKLALNNVSSAAMGKLGRLTGNWMSCVDASNKKLIDRSVRLIVELCGVDYRTACRALYATFEEMKGWNETQLKTVSPVAHTIKKLRKAPEPPALAWRMELGGPGGVRSSLASGEMRSAETRRTADEVTTVWKGHPKAGEAFQVTGAWRRGPDGVWVAGLSYSGYAGTDFIQRVSFPIVTLPAPAGKPLGYVFGGYDIGYGGTLAPGQGKGFTVECGVPLLEVLPPGGTGFHFDFRDAGHHPKAFSLANAGTNLVCACLSQIGIGEKPLAAYALPCGFGFKRTRGGWFEGAQAYKAWSGLQAWSRPKAGPDRLRPIGMWVWNRGLITNVIPPVIELQKALGDIPVALDWYWWHHNPYDSWYPDFWPPREGEEAFKAAVADLNRRGIYSQVYVNGVCWDMDGGSWSADSVASAVMDRKSGIQNHVFNTYNHHRLASMCGENTAFFDRLAGVIGKIAASGLPGVYTDMIGCGAHAACYNPAHRHPKGDGPYAVEGYRAFARRLRRENPGLALTTETASEDFLDVYDGGITCNTVSNERLGAWLDPLPVFQAVHHGKGYALFGNYALADGVPPWDPLWPAKDRWQHEKPWNALFPVQFYYELGRTAVWGIQPMVCNLTTATFTDPANRDIRDFILETARFYRDNLAFLYDGEMLSPGGFACATARVEFVSRMIFTKEGQERIIEKQLPAVIHSCWKAPDGRQALFLVNPTQQPQPWTFGARSGTLAPHRYEKVPLDP